MPWPRSIRPIRPPRPSAERTAQRSWLLLWLYLTATVLLPGLHAATHERAHDHHAGGLHYHHAAEEPAQDPADSEDHDHDHPHAHAAAERLPAQTDHRADDAVDSARVPDHDHAQAELAGATPARAQLTADSAVASHSPLSDHAAGSLSHFAQSHLGTPTAVARAAAARCAKADLCRAVQDAHRACQVAGSLGARAPPQSLVA